MRKFLFFLLLIPAMVALGHDIYIYQQEPEKGFRLSDLGALWDKYDKETHDQWKTKVRDVSRDIKEYIPENPVPENMIPEGLIPEGLIPEGLISDTDEDDSETADEKETKEPEIVVEEVVEESTKPANFGEGFSQSIDRDGTESVRALGPEDYKDGMEENTGRLISIIGFILEQKAVFVAGAVPLFFFLLNLIISPFFREKQEMDKIKSIKKKKRKGGGYTYSRK